MSFGKTVSVVSDCLTQMQLKGVSMAVIDLKLKFSI